MKCLLTGIRVLEISSVVLGPLAGQILADMGAEVFKIEPLDGDIARASHPQRGGTGALYVNNNRNKKAIAIDLKSIAGKAVLSRMVAQSDILLHNMRIEAVQRLGLDFETAVAINPRLIYCSAIGFGQHGRYRHRPAFDDIIQAASGLARLAERLDGEPRYVPTILADKIGALYAVYGMLAALVARERGRDKPIEVEVPMFEAIASFVLNEHLAEATFDENGCVGYPRVLSPDRRPYRSRDGWIAVLPYTTEQWRRFLCEADRSDICQAPWFADSLSRHEHLDYLYAVLSSVLPGRTTSDWIETLSGLDVPCSEVNRLEDLLNDPHLADIGFFDVGPSYPPHIQRTLPQPVIFSTVDTLPDSAPPSLGANTREVLKTFQYQDEEIASMIATGIVRQQREGS
jgi:crotonobetainyl-CoA:carnitine CoA-transferase CaiB-like acyl-CoA transferase